MIDIGAIFKREGDHLCWERLADANVVGGATGEEIQVDEAYFVVRMKEMYLGEIRFLWRKYYPVLHAFTEAGGEEAHAVSGPGQLQDLGNVNLDRVVVLNDRLHGPAPYRGGDVTILIGLYSVPGQDAAKALISMVSGLAALGGPVAPAAQVASVVKQGVDSILGLGETKLRLGVEDSFYPAGRPLRSGFHVGIAAKSTDVDTATLWLKDGRLVTGRDPMAARPYEAHDYMVIAIERVDRRDDWPALPELADFNERFGRIMADDVTVDEKRAKLTRLWPAFQQALAGSSQLVRPDRERIAGSVREDLRRRLDEADGGGPFERRSWGSRKPLPAAPDVFDLAEVDDYIDPADPESAAIGRAALSAGPEF